MRRWLHYSPDEWDALSWDVRQAYLDGLSAEEDIPFRIQEDAGSAFRATGTEAAAPVPATRTVSSAVAVIDLDAMRRELEANPAARQRR